MAVESALKPFPGPVLGIESSCDETAAAVLDAEGRVLAEAVLSQGEQHAPTRPGLVLGHANCLRDRHGG